MRMTVTSRRKITSMKTLAMCFGVLPLGIALYSIEANSPHAYVSSLTLIQLLVLPPPLVAITLLVHFMSVATEKCR
jgi:hypothetical protein